MPTRAEFVAGLAALPKAGPVRLAALLADRDCDEAWALVVEGRVPSEVASAALRGEWRAFAASADLAAFGTALGAVDGVATCWHCDGHPDRFRHDIDPAPVAFRRGTSPDPDLPAVAIVGTRRASGVGREMARELGMGLAGAGVVVVSGLALGVDGAAHQGALLAAGAPPVAVVGSGIDRAYPADHRGLWDEVAAAGSLLSEAPMGARPVPWRFPLRNRLIVALSDLVIVVESRAAGGSLITVDEAIRRGVDVMAVPGSVRNGAAIGTNQLLADGCAPVRDVADVTAALGLVEAETASRRDMVASKRDDGAILTSIDDGPTSIDEIVARTGRPVSEVTAEVARLELDGRVVADGARVRRT